MTKRSTATYIFHYYKNKIEHLFTIKTQIPNKIRLEMTELRRFKAFMQMVALERVMEFYAAETVQLNETAPPSQNSTEQLPLSSVEPSEHIHEIIDEMYTTYNMHLNEFDFQLFEDFS
jgi:hypothetical protein